jgi:hypothetical protein
MTLLLTLYLVSIVAVAAALLVWLCIRRLYGR